MMDHLFHIFKPGKEEAKRINLPQSEFSFSKYIFPLFEGRLQFQKSPTAVVIDFAEKIKSADSDIITTPEYYGGYPASIKNEH